jgi:hypothetical protein
VQFQNIHTCTQAKKKTDMILIYGECRKDALDYFLWGTVKEKVYSTPLVDIDDLKNRIPN